MAFLSKHLTSDSLHPSARFLLQVKGLAAPRKVSLASITIGGERKVLSGKESSLSISCGRAGIQCVRRPGVCPAEAMRSAPSVAEQRAERFDGAATAAAVPGRSASSGGCESRASDTPYLRAGQRALVARRWWVFRRSLARRGGLTNFSALLFRAGARSLQNAAHPSEPLRTASFK